VPLALSRNEKRDIHRARERIIQERYSKKEREQAKRKNKKLLDDGRVYVGAHSVAHEMKIEGVGLVSLTLELANLQDRLTIGSLEKSDSEDTDLALVIRFELEKAYHLKKNKEAKERSAGAPPTTAAAAQAALENPSDETEGTEEKELIDFEGAEEKEPVEVESAKVAEEEEEEAAAPYPMDKFRLRVKLLGDGQDTVTVPTLWGNFKAGRFVSLENPDGEESWIYPGEADREQALKDAWALTQENMEKNKAAMHRNWIAFSSSVHAGAVACAARSQECYEKTKEMLEKKGDDDDDDDEDEADERR